MSKTLDRMLEKSKMTKEDLQRHLKNPKGKGLLKAPKRAVEDSAELRRILELPRRSWEAGAAEYVDILTKHLRTPQGQQKLRPIQAAALVEAHDWKGMIGSIRVGGGKCVCSGTEVFDASEGRRRLVEDLGSFHTVSMREGEGTLEVACAVSVQSGSKDCYRLTLANGMVLDASFDHPIYTGRGWVWLRDLAEDDLVATARSIPDPVRFTEASDDEVKLAALRCSNTGQRVPPSFWGLPKDQVRLLLSYLDLRVAESESLLSDIRFLRGRLAETGPSDLAWERIDKVEHLGEREVFDLSVPSHGNFVANGIVIHNTLISLLACLVLEAKRPVLLLPAKLIEKTKRESAALRKHWVIPGYVRLVSYELLGRANHAKLLEEMQPDLIVADECHKLANTSAAVTRRVKRYLDSNPECAFIGMSGTITKRSLHDYAHLCQWALKKTNPTPATFPDRMAWAFALDEKTTQAAKQERLAPGRLVEFCTEEERAKYAQSDDYEEAVGVVRRAYRRRVTETPGFIASMDGELGVSLTIDSLHAPLPATVMETISTMAQTWERPDGVEVIDAIELWRHMREIACGFYYRWNPEPPQEWRKARSAWAKFVREVLRTNRLGLDSESQVARAVDQGAYPGDILRVWREIRPTFTPQTEAVWLHDVAIKSVLKWAKESPGIVWVEHVELGKALRKVAGLSYYGKGGQDERGRPIEAHPPGASMVASLSSNAEGRNLQAWSNNLMTSPPTSGATWEQILGRTHRDGQQAEEVTCTLLLSLPVQLEAFRRATLDAQYIQDTTGQAQKLAYADLAVEDPWGQEAMVRKKKG